MRKIHFAVVGLGNIARTHIVALRAFPAIKKSSVLPVLDTLITRDPERLRAQAEALGFAHIGSLLPEALAARPIDAVDICTPNALHLDAVLAAFDSGRSVYCEKPLCDSYERSRRLAEAAEAAGAGSAFAPMHRGGAAGRPGRKDSEAPSAPSLRFIGQAALTYRYHPAVMRIREALRLKLIGDVLQCRIAFLHSGYLNPNRPVSWRLDESLAGGGAVTDLGVHVIDLIRHWFGEITDVTGETSIFVKERPIEAGSPNKAQMTVDDWALLRFETASGVKGAAEVSRIAWGAEAFRVEIFGSGGSITCDLEHDYLPRIKRLDGSSPAVPAPSCLELVPDEKMTMGQHLDCHFGSLHHFMLRLADEDRWAEEGLAPELGDCLEAERWIAAVLAANGAALPGNKQTDAEGRR